MIQKKDLPQQTKRKGILALFLEGFWEGFNASKEEPPRQLSKNYKKVVSPVQGINGEIFDCPSYYLPFEHSDQEILLCPRDETGIHRYS